MLLSVESLTTYFFLDEGILKAVDDLSFTVEEQETVALVGESGCGKTIVAHSIMNLVAPPGRIVEGRVLFNDEDLLQIGQKRLRQIRGNKIGLVFQEPGAALNPVFTIGQQIGEVTVALFSPRLEKNIGYAMLPTECGALGTSFDVETPFGRARATVAQKPFIRKAG